jgi:hypothetical protein
MFPSRASTELRQRVQQFKLRKCAQDFQPLVFKTFGYWSEEVGVSICHQMKILQELRTRLCNYWDFKAFIHIAMGKCDNDRGAGGFCQTTR